jgi:hypothetical protein
MSLSKMPHNLLGVLLGSWGSQMHMTPSGGSKQETLCGDEMVPYLKLDIFIGRLGLTHF